jgi:hypothetical protein
MLRWALACVATLHWLASLVRAAVPVSRHAVFVSIALPGHLTPLLGQAEALLLRGWHVSIVSSDDASGFVEDTLATWPLSVDDRNRVTFRSLGNLDEWERNATGSTTVRLRRTEDVFLEASSHEDFQAGSFLILDWLFEVIVGARHGHGRRRGRSCSE